MPLFAFLRGFRIRKDKTYYHDIKRLIRANKWAIRGVCKNSSETFRIFYGVATKNNTQKMKK